MADASVPQIVANLIASALGLSSSASLLLWSTKLSPLQRTIAAHDTIEDGSDFRKASELDAAGVRADLPELLRQETKYLRASGVLLGLSFIVGAVAQFL